MRAEGPGRLAAGGDGAAPRLRPVDKLAGAENDPAFLASTPAASSRRSRTATSPWSSRSRSWSSCGPLRADAAGARPDDPTFPAYQQILHLGEAGLARPIYFVVVSVLCRARGRATRTGRLQGVDQVEQQREAGAAQLAEAPYSPARRSPRSTPAGPRCSRPCPEPTRPRTRAKGRA